MDTLTAAPATCSTSHFWGGMLTATRTGAWAAPRAGRPPVRANAAASSSLCSILCDFVDNENRPGWVPAP
jgi:hypothetical protein